MATKESLPRIIAMTGLRDSGAYGNASCPHCGAIGRYVWTFICEDGTSRGAMSGCIQLFRLHPVARVTQIAFNKVRDAEELKKKPASWFIDIVAATQAFAAGEIDRQTMFDRVNEAENRRQVWLRRNGYGKCGKYRR